MSNMSKSFDIVINEERVNKKKIFVVHCLNLGITSQGKTVEDAMSNIKDAIKLFLEENPSDISNSEDLMPPMATKVFI